MRLIITLSQNTNKSKLARRPQRKSPAKRTKKKAATRIKRIKRKRMTKRRKTIRTIRKIKKRRITTTNKIRVTYWAVNMTQLC